METIGSYWERKAENISLKGMVRFTLVALIIAKAGVWGFLFVMPFELTTYIIWVLAMVGVDLLLIVNCLILSKFKRVGVSDTQATNTPEESRSSEFKTSKVSVILGYSVIIISYGVMLAGLGMLVAPTGGMLQMVEVNEGQIMGAVFIAIGAIFWKMSGR